MCLFLEQYDLSLPSINMFKMVVYPLVKQRTCRMGLNHLRNLATVGHFFDPKNDVAFKKIFGVEQNKPLLLSFLNSMLR